MLTIHGKKVDAKMLKKKIKETMHVEREKFNMDSRSKLFKRSEELIKRHKKEMQAI